MFISVDNQRPPVGGSSRQVDTRRASICRADRSNDRDSRCRHDPQCHRHPPEHGLEGDSDTRQSGSVRDPGAVYWEPVSAGVWGSGHAADGEIHAVEWRTRTAG